VRGLLNMPQDVDSIYNWRRHEKIILGFASAWGWLHISWIVFGTWVAFLFYWLSELPPFYQQAAFWSYVISCLLLHIGTFGILAYFFPKFYILPAWIITLCFALLGLRKIALFLIFMDEPDKFYYMESGETRFHFFSSDDIYRVIIYLIFLIVLYRPALFYLRRLAGWRFGRHKGEG